MVVLNEHDANQSWRILHRLGKLVNGKVEICAIVEFVVLFEHRQLSWVSAEMLLKSGKKRRFLCHEYRDAFEF